MYQLLLKNMKNNENPLLYMIIFVTFLAGMVAIYWSVNNENKIVESIRIADSLRIEVAKYNTQYDSILTIAKRTDSVLASKEENVRIVKQSFIVYKTTPITNSDTAIKFLQDFIKE
jgi:hypothetical protein